MRGIGLAVVMPALALSSIGQAATPEQMLRWAPECFGEPGNLKLAALCISEPEGGSDVRNLRTTATRDGDEWVIEGHKMWIGNGGIADVHVVNATVDPDLGHRGQALFVVPGASPGIELVRKLDKLGCRASHTAELKFHQVRVPADHLLGGDDKLQNRMRKAREVQEEVATGAPRRKSATLGTFEQTRPMVAAQALGIARAALEYATEYANRREAFERPDNRQPGHRVSAGRPGDPDRRGATAHVAGVVDGGGGRGVPPRRGLDGELAASEVAVKTTERALQTMGGWDTSASHPVEKWYRDAKLYTIFEGTSEIQRMVIGRALGAADGAPPLHFDQPTEGSAFNRRFGRGTSVRTKAGEFAMSMKDRMPESAQRLAMKILAPPKK